MKSNRAPISERELDRHVAALRDFAAGREGPAPQIVAETQAMLWHLAGHGGDGSGARRLPQSSRAASHTRRIAAVLVIALGALALYAAFALLNAGGSTTFADVAGKFSSARTLAFTSTVTVPGQRPRTTRTMMADPRRIRSETPDGMISILNGKNTMLFVPQQPMKTAVQADPSGPLRKAGADERSIIDALRALADQKAEPIGETKINGVAAVGFRTTNGQQQTTVWADKKTATPLRVEMTLNLGNGNAGGGKAARVVMEKFEIDLALEDSLFSLEPPPDYQLATPPGAAAAAPPPTSAVDTIEDAAVELLRAYAAVNDGAFPPTLLDFQASIKLQIQGRPDPQLTAKVGTLANLLREHPDGYGYAGRDVTFGDKNRIVFWYRAENSKTYRAVFGDLRVANVTAAQLPANQSDEP